MPILVSLERETSAHRGIRARAAEETCRKNFPASNFYFLPADIVSQILNFGLPAPIDMQIDRKEHGAQSRLAQIKLLTQIAPRPRRSRFRIQQTFDQPKLHIDVDRTKAPQADYTQSDIAQKPADLTQRQFPDARRHSGSTRKNGVSYNLVDASPAIRSRFACRTCETSRSTVGTAEPGDPRRCCVHQPWQALAVGESLQYPPDVDIYASVDGRDLGGVGAMMERIVECRIGRNCRAALQLSSRGQIETMQLIVLRTDRWAPVVDRAGVPADRRQFPVLARSVHHHYGVAGRSGWNCCVLFMTHTTLSVPALMGAIMCMGVATANSILVVSFAKERLLEGSDAIASRDGGRIYALPSGHYDGSCHDHRHGSDGSWLGEGGEQNAPLGRAVIGGLSLATVATLFFVPVVFSIVHGRRRQTVQQATEKS